MNQSYMQRAVPFFQSVGFPLGEAFLKAKNIWLEKGEEGASAELDIAMDLQRQSSSERKIQQDLLIEEVLNRMKVKKEQRKEQRSADKPNKLRIKKKATRGGIQYRPKISPVRLNRYKRQPAVQKGKRLLLAISPGATETTEQIVAKMGIVDDDSVLPINLSCKEFNVDTVTQNMISVFDDRSNQIVGSHCS